MRLSPWTAAAATLTGAAHVRDGTGSQDVAILSSRYAGVRASESAPLLCVVADGLGSYERSAEAAHLAASLLMNCFVDRLSDGGGGFVRAPASSAARRDLLQRSFEDAASMYDYTRSALDNLSMGYQGETTLAAVWALEDGLVVGSIGDSFTVLMREDRSCHLVLAPEAIGEHANETSIFSSAEIAHGKLNLFSVSDPTIVGIALSTDGLSEVLLAQGRSKTEVVPQDEFFLLLYDGLVSGRHSYIDLVRILAKFGKRHADDLSLVFAWR